MIVKGPKSNVQLLEENLAKLIHNKLTTNDPQVTIFIDGTEEITNEFFLKNWRNLTWGVRELGIEPNEVVALISENSWKFMACLMASLSLGTPIHVLNPDYKPYELKHLLMLSKPKLVYCTNKSVANLLSLREDLPFLQHLVMLDEDYTKENVLFYHDLVKDQKNSQFYFADINPNSQIAFIHNSSGTTGLPKGIQTTHSSYSKTYIYQMFPEYASVLPNESHLLYLPLFHGYGTYLAMSGLCAANSTGVILPKFRPHDFYNALSIHKIRSINVVPTILNFMANSDLDKNYDLGSFREVICSGAASRDVDVTKVCKKFGLKTVRNLYGMGEGVVCISVMPPNKTKKNSIGKLFPDRQLKVVDRKTRETLRAYQVGEICVKGPIFAGYINDPDKSREATSEDGFLFTGDAGYYDNEGFIYLVDRLKDLIKYKAYQVAPTELEVILQKHKAVKDVAVVGLPDERAGELAMAFVVKNDDQELTEKELKAFLSEYVSDHKQLHGGVKFVESIPKNPTGKILRRILKQQLTQEQ